MIYFTSDLHLGHDNVIKFENRPFETVEEMNQKLIENYNSIVNKNDTVYILGDLAYKIPKVDAERLITQLKGKKILIRGNHDKKYNPDLFEEICDYKEVNFNKQHLILMHYPMLSWKRSRRGSIQLHGHIHSIKGVEYNEEGFAVASYNEDCKSKGIRRYDVGVDANGFMPVSINQILLHFGIEF